MRNYWILGVLILLFLGYSINLYIHTPREKPKKESPVSQGKLLWQQKNCTACHQFYGLGGHLGPDLTHITSKRSRDRIETFIKFGTNVMPAFDLSESELNSLIAFLESVNQSGSGDPRTFNLHLDGTISQ